MFVLGIDPGLSRCGYGLVATWPRTGPAWLAAVAAGVIETDPATPLPSAALRRCRPSCASLLAEYRPTSWSSSGSSSRSTRARRWRVGQASGAGPAAAAEARLRGRAVHRQRGQAGGGRLRGRHQGPGPADGRPGARAGRAARAPGRRRRAGPGGLPPHGACRCRAAVRAADGRWRDRLAPRDLVPRGPRRRGHRRRRRRRLPGDRVAGDRRRRSASPGATPVLCTCTPTSARTPSSSTASLHATSGAASRRCSARTASAPPSRWPSSRTLSPAALSTALLEDDVDALCAVPGVGRKTAARLLLDLKSRLELPDLAGDGRRARRRRPRRRAPRCGRALAELGYGPEEIRRAARAAAGRPRTVEDAAAPGAPGAGGAMTAGARRGARRTPTPGADGSRRRPRPTAGRPGADRARGARRGRLRPRTLDEFVGQRAAGRAPRDRPRGGAPARASRSTTCCSPGPRASARPRWPASWPPRWASACASPRARCSPGPATSPRCSPTSRRATSCSSTRSTGCTASVEEVLYPAMEDSQLDILIGKGPTARSIRLDLPRFTLVGATTRTGLVAEPAARPVRVRRPARPLRARASSRRIVVRSARILGVAVDAEGRRRDRRAVAGHAADRQPAAAPGPRLRRGARRRRHHRRGRRRGPGALRRRRARPRQGRPGDPRHAVPPLRRPPGRAHDPGPVRRRGARHVEDAYEPYLLQQGLLQRTPRGRVATARAFAHLGVAWSLQLFEQRLEPGRPGR